MDTSITFAFVAAVLFAFVLPAVLRRSARVDEGLPLDAEAVESVAAGGCAVDRSRPGLLDREHSALVDLPAGPEIAAEPPSLRLRRDEPALTVIDGSAEQAAASDETSEERAEADVAEVAVLPLASGQSAPIAVAQADHPRPVDATVQHPTAHTPRLPMEPHMNVTPQTEPRRIAAAAERMPQALPADIRARLDRSYQTAPRVSGQRRGETASAGSSEQRAAAPAGPSAAQRRRLRRLRAVLPFCGIGVIGFALLTVGLIITAAVTSLSWAAPVVTAALTVGALALVRALNREIRALRRGEEPAKPSARPAAPTRRTADSHSRTVLTADELDGDATGEIPLVAPAEDAADAAAEPVADDAPDVLIPDAVVLADADEAPSLSLGAPESAEADDDAEAAAIAAETSADEDSSAAAEESAPAARPDPMSARLAAGGWTPKGLPAPRYAEAPVAEREQPEPVVADASSYTLAPTTKEALAEAFAEELGYRPEIADHAAEAGPLRHGRNAIRSTGTEGASAPEASVSALGDVLARRRA